jgi:pimeloyl-ACP methyl ester carboxylesterase
MLTAEALAQLGAPETAREAVAEQLANAELFVALRHAPQRVLPRVRVPVLALTGSLDSVVDADANLAAIAAALAGNPDVTTVKLARLNHFFQTAVTGDPGEYADLNEDFAPVALNTISRWIDDRFGSR